MLLRNHEHERVNKKEGASQWGFMDDTDVSSIVVGSPRPAILDTGLVALVLLARFQGIGAGPQASSSR